jgi:flagellar hook assembly protein FlgD
VKVLSTGDDNLNLPKEYALLGNYPNPFNPSTTISYALPEASKVQIVVYDILGKVVTKLVNTEQQAGYHKAVFNGDRYSSGVQYASGVYIYRISAVSTSGKRFEKVSKLMLVK